ncbi:hypothetical protein BDY21DRAFT_356698 [Lineolata rhizophorae]|uniref:Uncharacterized protein n=1 Tax=Lineolata rhizophorae TaxID=578093 RepID=A0A6A6NPF2_9PEZI|nr:hypothetical protein BDY21DRAFT_356698 [Lineolata rhizophorae]
MWCRRPAHAGPRAGLVSQQPLSRAARPPRKQKTAQATPLCDAAPRRTYDEHATYPTYRACVGACAWQTCGRRARLRATLHRPRRGGIT